MSRQPSRTWLALPNTSGNSARLKGKLIVFKAVVLNSLLHGLEVAGLSEADIVCLEKAQDQMLRTVLGEGGCRTVLKDGKKIFLRSSTKEVLQLAGFGTVRSDLRARRLCWLRRACATERADGIAFPPLAAVCGRFSWEKRDACPTRQQQLFTEDLEFLLDHEVWLCDGEWKENPQPQP